MTGNTLKQIRDIAITLLYTDIHPTNIHSLQRIRLQTIIM